MYTQLNSKLTKTILEIISNVDCREDAMIDAETGLQVNSCRNIGPYKSYRFIRFSNDDKPVAQSEEQVVFFVSEEKVIPVIMKSKNSSVISISINGSDVSFNSKVQSSLVAYVENWLETLTR